MNDPAVFLKWLLIGAATGQVLIAGLNLGLVRWLNWQPDLDRVSLLVREVFHVHKWFITITLLIFAAITFRFAGDLSAGTNEIGRWIAGGIGIFWAVRTAMQWLYYDVSHWRGKPGKTAIHWTLTISYGGCATVYLVAAWGGG